MTSVHWNNPPLILARTADGAKSNRQQWAVGDVSKAYSTDLMSHPGLAAQRQDYEKCCGCVYTSEKCSIHMKNLWKTSEKSKEKSKKPKKLWRTLGEPLRNLGGTAK